MTAVAVPFATRPEREDERIRREPETKTADNKLRVLTLAELLVMEIPEREVILSPWLLTQSLSMIHAYRGIGKTHVALGIAYAIATGGAFLAWQASRPRLGAVSRRRDAGGSVARSASCAGAGR